MIAFPKTAKGTDLMSDSGPPRPQLRDLHINLRVPKPQEEKADEN